MLLDKKLSVGEPPHILENPPSLRLMDKELNTINIQKLISNI